MRRDQLVTVLGILLSCGHQPVSLADGLCGPLQKFVQSVKPNETRVFKFHTVWGGDFNGSKEPAIYAKRCENYHYLPAKEVCSYLMTNGATEFSGNNAKDAVACLSPKTRFATGTQLDALSLSLTYGTEARGALVDVEYSEDKELGGMVLSVKVTGY